MNIELSAKRWSFDRILHRLYGRPLFDCVFVSLRLIVLRIVPTYTLWRRVTPRIRLNKFRSVRGIVLFIIRCFGEGKQSWGFVLNPADII